MVRITSNVHKLAFSGLCHGWVRQCYHFFIFLYFSASDDLNDPNKPSQQWQLFFSYYLFVSSQFFKEGSRLKGFLDETGSWTQVWKKALKFIWAKRSWEGFGEGLIPNCSLVSSISISLAQGHTTDNITGHYSADSWSQWHRCHPIYLDHTTCYKNILQVWWYIYFP